MTEQLLDIGVTALRDGREVVIRPLEAGDRAALTAFGRALPEYDLQYLADDFLSPQVIARLINMCSAEHWRQPVATSGDAIVAYSAVRQSPGWSSHVGEIQLVVSGGWRRNGLGTVLVAALIDAAPNLEITQVIVQTLEEQAAGRAICERLGFHTEGVLADHVQDQRGRHHSLRIMSRQV